MQEIMDMNKFGETPIDVAGNNKDMQGKDQCAKSAGIILDFYNEHYYVIDNVFNPPKKGSKKTGTGNQVENKNSTIESRDEPYKKK